MAAVNGLKAFFLGKNSNQAKQSATNTAYRANVIPSARIPIMGIAATSIDEINSTVIGTYLKQMLSYLLAIAIIILIILIFVHFFITPIFSLQPGAPGIFVIPGLDEGVLFWNKSSTESLSNNILPIQNMAYGYSLITDIFIQDPHVHFSTHPRILFRRGGTIRANPTGNTLLGLLDGYNFVCALLPDTNDLIVSILNVDNNTENVIIPNVAIQEPFRLGIIFMNHALEVYINGHLMKTRTFSAAPKDIKGDIYPMSGIETNLAKLRNLKIWPRVLTSSEIRYAKPALTTAGEFGSSSMSTTSQCNTDMSIDSIKSMSDKIRS